QRKRALAREKAQDVLRLLMASGWLPPGSVDFEVPRRSTGEASQSSHDHSAEPDQYDSPDYFVTTIADLARVVPVESLGDCLAALQRNLRVFHATRSVLGAPPTKEAPNAASRAHATQPAPAQHDCPPVLLFRWTPGSHGTLRVLNAFGFTDMYPVVAPPTVPAVASDDTQDPDEQSKQGTPATPDMTDASDALSAAQQAAAASQHRDHRD
ncbi:MAG: hypothetical protein L0H29_10860, partial [Sinobacteraceae bacterium]|nr:hypothetical protein [Nevskiaceae bacterium]